MINLLLAQPTDRFYQSTVLPLRSNLSSIFIGLYQPKP